MEIAYKVIGPKRYGSNATGYEYYTETPIESFLERNPSLKQYFPLYVKGTIVRCAPGSAGVLCFEKAWQAEQFIYTYDKLLAAGAFVIKVHGLAKKAHIGKLVSGLLSCLSDLHYLNTPSNDDIQRNGASIWLSPHAHDGVVAYNAVKVLE